VWFELISFSVLISGLLICTDISRLNCCCVDIFHMLLYFRVLYFSRWVVLGTRSHCVCFKNVTILVWIVVHMTICAKYIPYRSMNEFYGCLFTVTWTFAIMVALVCNEILNCSFVCWFMQLHCLLTCSIKETIYFKFMVLYFSFPAQWSNTQVVWFLTRKNWKPARCTPFPSKYGPFRFPTYECSYASSIIIMPLLLWVPLRTDLSKCCSWVLLIQT